jgi:hypothetical protein
MEKTPLFALCFFARSKNGRFLKSAGWVHKNQKLKVNTKKIREKRLLCF